MQWLQIHVCLPAELKENIVVMQKPDAGCKMQ